MGGTLKTFFFLLLVATKGRSHKTDTADDSNENLKEEISKHNKDTRDSLKIDLQSVLSLLSASLNQRFVSAESRTSSELETKINKLNKKLSESVDKEVNKSQTKILSELGKLKKVLLESVDQKINESETRILSQLENATDKLERKLSSLFPTHVKTEVEELSEINGTIKFVGEPNVDIRRKIWVLWAKGNTERLNQRFVMEENNLGENAHLSLWGSDKNSTTHVWNGSQTGWKKERTASGNLVLLTLMVKPSATSGPPPSFKLKFTSTRGKRSWEHLDEIITKDGVQSILYPHQNAKNYSPKSAFQAVIAPQSGKSFSLNLKYLDVPGSRPKCSDNSFRVYLLEQNTTVTNYKILNTSEFSECGKLGNVSEFIGTSTVAIVRFYALTNNTGKGFQMEIKPN